MYMWTTDNGSNTYYQYKTDFRRKLGQGYQACEKLLEKNCMKIPIKNKVS